MIDKMIVKSNDNKENWTDKDWDKFKVWLKDLLITTSVTVNFTKKDGSERIMKCSLEESKIPKTTLVEGKLQRKIPNDLIVVYDLDIKEWRSFNIRQINKVEVTL